MEKRWFSRAATAGFGRDHMGGGGYGRIGVYREQPLSAAAIPLIRPQFYPSSAATLLIGSAPFFIPQGWPHQLYEAQSYV